MTSSTRSPLATGNGGTSGFQATPFIDLSPDDSGLFDQEFNETSLVKTNITRPGNSAPTASIGFDALSIKGLV